jgi:hypothetical protein
MSEWPMKSFFAYTQKDVANTALSVSSLAALGATAGTTIAPGPGSVVGGLVGGLAGFVIERLVDLKPSTQREVEAREARDELRRSVGVSAAEEIEKLDRLKKSGSITGEEFARLRGKIVE